MHTFIKSALKAAMLLAAMLATGCQDLGGTTGDAGGGSSGCNPIYGALAGAALGALVGGTTGNSGGKRAAEGAAIGAGAGALACVAFNAYSKRTRTSQQVTQDYETQHHGQQPATPVVTAYNVNVNPADGVQPGNTANVNSSMTVVDGASQPVGQIKEALTLSGPNGQMHHEKVVNQDSSGGGSYQNQFQIKLPSGLEQGAYQVKTQLYVNGQMLAERQQNLQVVRIDGVLHVAMQ
jgi:hypothetical protein